MTIAETSPRADTFIDPVGLQPGATKSIPLDGAADPDSRFDVWRRRIRLRRHLKRLLRLDAGLIEDIGLTLQEARREVGKPFWRL